MTTSTPPAAGAVTDSRMDTPARAGTDLTIVVYGTPAPQGSKNGFAIRKNGAYNGKVAMRESSMAVKPWRADVKAAALEVMGIDFLGVCTVSRPPLDGPLAASMVFTVREQPTGRPTWWPKGERHSAKLRWRPASKPDLSKLLRSTEDALSGVAWTDDARVVEYTRLAKYYVGHPAEDVLDRPGAVIRIWRIGGDA